VKRWFKRITPDAQVIRNHRHLRIFGTLLQDPNLWHLNRRSVSGAFAVGLFTMYLPPFGQMVVAAAAAIALRVNLPISVALVWLTNPLTIPPMYYFSYLVGSWILGTPAAAFDVGFWLEWRNWLHIIAPLTLGSLICGTFCSAAGYLAVQGLWRWNLVQQIQRRKARLQRNRIGKEAVREESARDG
jgi:uncharacterized protein (DUF2062 family)